MALIPFDQIPHEFTVGDLRRWADLFFSHLEETGCSTIKLNHSFYWSHTPSEQLYNPYETPDAPGLDDLFDNLRDVMDFEQNPDTRCLPILEDFAALLTYISTGLPFEGAE